MTIKSIVATTDIKPGELLTEDNITISEQPANGSDINERYYRILMKKRPPNTHTEGYAGVKFTFGGTLTVKKEIPSGSKVQWPHLFNNINFASS